MKTAAAWTFAGVVIGLLLAIGYNTSADVAALEGGRGHLSFNAVVMLGAGGGALAGLVVGGAFAVLLGAIREMRSGSIN